MEWIIVIIFGTITDWLGSLIAVVVGGIIRV